MTDIRYAPTYGRDLAGLQPDDPDCSMRFRILNKDEQDTMPWPRPGVSDFSLSIEWSVSLIELYEARRIAAEVADPLAAVPGDAT